MGELFAEIGDLVFTLVIGYISAIEFLYVVRHLYHYSCNHDGNEGVDSAENLSQLQDSMSQQLANAKNREAAAGTQLMKDGVPYKDGFRLEAQQALIDQLKEQLKNKELSDLRRQELEKELSKQKKIAEQLRKELAEAEAKYQRQLKEEEEAHGKKFLEERKQREREEREEIEAAEQAYKLAEAERQRETEHREKERQQLEEQQRKEAEDQERKLAEVEQRKREEEERIKKEAEQKYIEQIQREEEQRKEAEEEAHKLKEAENQREIEQRQREEAGENAQRLQEAEKQRELEHRMLEEQQAQAMQKLQDEEEKEEARKQQQIAEAEKNAQRLLEIEKANEEKQAAEEEAAELAAKNLLAIEHRLEEQLRAAEKEAELTEKEHELIDSIKKRDLSADEGNIVKEAELLRKILEAREQLGEESEEEQSLRLIQRERDQEAKQKRIEENALLFMEAENEMAELQNKMLDAVEKRVFTGSLDSAPQTPIVEEPCIKRTFSALSGGEYSHSTVKTQLAQDLNEPYSVRTKPLLFPGISDDASSIDPASSQQSLFSTQPSEEIATGTDSQYPAQERQEPDGEDTNLTNLQYSDDYLRSLDGIKQRPLMREDGSGRRRAFKKRRSSNSSNSSRESRHSRDDELKMFTSLEEEEMKDTTDSDFTPIRYSTEPTLKVKGHHRRHKRSPAKDMRRGDDSLRSSLERLGEETSDPWGEVKPEHYKHTEFWKREKALSIDEEMEFEKRASSEEVPYDTDTNMASTSSYEEATETQNQKALTALQKHSAQKDVQKETQGDQDAGKDESARSDNLNLQISQIAEKDPSPARSSASPRLRRSPCVEVIDQYEKNWKEQTDKSAFSTAQNTPTINVQAPSDFGPWRDEYGLMMEGLSDFYDFTASTNPSRSRSASRNVSPANTAPNTPLPKNISFQLNLSMEKVNEKATVEIYDDTENLEGKEFKKENIIELIDSLNGDKINSEEEINDSTGAALNNQLQYVADDPSETSSNQASLVPLVNIIDNVAANDSSNLEGNESAGATMSTLVNSLRSQRPNRSRSRSKSPLPTSDNLKRSVENRRYKMIKHNEDILEKLIETKLLPELTFTEELEENCSTEKNQITKVKLEAETECSSLVQSLNIDQRRSRSKSPMRLPTAENLSKGLEKRRTKLIERNDELIKQLEERSLTPESPTIVVEHVYEIESSGETSILSSISPRNGEPLSPSEEEDCSREKMDLLVQSLRAARSRTRSKSPMRVQGIENFNETSEAKALYGFQHAEDVKTTQQLEMANVPTISIVFSEAEPESCTSPKVEDEDDCSREKMDMLIQSLRVARSRSTSKSPMQTMREIQLEGERSRHSRSKSPSRSHSQSSGYAAAYYSNTLSRSLSPQSDDHDDFHVLLNLEGSDNRTLSINTEAQESLHLAHRQRQLDEEALEKLRNASEEMELRTLSPLIADREDLYEHLSKDYLAGLPLTERSKLLRKSPTTPDYDRTISEEMRDVERIKQKILQKGFKRSTYVGESMDLGSEFETLRKETAKFQRSRSPSPSFSAIEDASAQRNAEEKREIQNLILQELTSSSAIDSKELKRTGAIPKTERFTSCELELSLNDELEDTKLIREEILKSNFQHTTHVEHTVTTENLEELRRRNTELERTANASRSPLHELGDLASIEIDAAKQVFKDRVLDEVSCDCHKMENFSRHLNADFFDNDRRASDSALLKVPQILLQHKDDQDMEPEEYHHYRKFSLAQEEPVEQYPSDDYIFIQQVEVRTRSGSRTWLREDFYSENVEEYLNRREQSKEKSIEIENNESARREEQDGKGLQFQEPGAEDDEEYSNASDDDRQTVVEVDDEIDEDISDFNEHGPAEESHHEISECEEAEREMDRYAGREATDWNQAVDADNMSFTESRANEIVNIEEDEGAVGGLSNSPYDSDSFAIDKIYDEAIKNRKQSGILREYDSILMQMSVNSDIDEQYLLWSKTNDKKSTKNVEFNTTFLDNERKDSEMRYLGDAHIMARQSARLRSRYGYNPVLQATSLEDDIQVDLNYKPKREYNWRKNFKLDEEMVKEDKEITLDEIYNQESKGDNEVENQKGEISNNNENDEMIMDLRKFSLGGESVTLFSRSSEKSMNSLEQQCEANEDLNKETLAEDKVKEDKVEKLEKPKKKKTKKKSHKESKTSLEENMNREDEDAYDNQVYSRRSSSLQMDTDSPKRKSRSRRSSKSSLTNEDSLGLFSPRSSVAYNAAIADIMEEFTDVAKEPARPKKMKKRKKVKETMANVAESPIESKEEFQCIMEPMNDIPAVSTVLTPESCSANILSILSPQHSVCVTPSSIDTDINLSIEELRENLNPLTNPSSSTTDSSPSENLSRTSSIASAPVDTFDILKDASFYPLF